MTIDVTRFHLPDGRRSQETTEIADGCASQVALILSCGCRFTSEILQTGMVSCCIEHPDLGDFDCKVTVNGPEVQRGIETMVMRFTK